MTTKFKNNNLIKVVVLLLLFSISLGLIFLITFKFTKKISCIILKDNIGTYLAVDAKTNNYLKEQNKQTILEFENKKYKIIYSYVKKYNDIYLYEMQTIKSDINISKSNIGYFYVNNLSFWDYLK